MPTNKKPTKKATAKKATAKKSTTSKKPAQKTQIKPQAKAKVNPKTAQLKTLISAYDTRRPPNNPMMPKNIIEMLTTDFGSIKELLEAFAQHLRSLDRRRLNGVGIKKQGFIERAFEFVLENPEFLPHYLTLEKFRDDGEYFIGFRTLTDLTNQIRELLWNITIISADIWYTDALEFYASVKEAAKRRVDPAETIYNGLEPFFSRPSRKDSEGNPALTKKKVLRDGKAIAAGKKDGIVIIENKKPKLTGGVHKVVDEEFKDTEQYKETEEGDYKE